MSTALFLRHFWHCWDQLFASREEAAGTDFPPMPGFFRFLTLLALHMFQEERVDVLVLEVGLGGELDSTNVVQRPAVCGVTALDYDHMRVLGPTLTHIAREVRLRACRYGHQRLIVRRACAESWHIQAWRACLHRAASLRGHGHAARTSASRWCGAARGACRAALDAGRHAAAAGAAGLARRLLRAHARAVARFSLRARWGGPLAGEFQRVNAGLAVALAHVATAGAAAAADISAGTADAPAAPAAALQQAGGSGARPSVLAPHPLTGRLVLSDAALRGLAQCHWPGRCQQVAVPGQPRARFLLDGAHTPLSMACCAQWFADCVARCMKAGQRPVLVLVFMCSAERNVAELLAPLCSLPLHHALFCPLPASRPSLQALPTAATVLRDARFRRHEAVGLEAVASHTVPVAVSDVADAVHAAPVAPAAPAAAEAAAPAARSDLPWHETVCSVFTAMASPPAVLAAARACTGTHTDGSVPLPLWLADAMGAGSLVGAGAAATAAAAAVAGSATDAAAAEAAADTAADVERVVAAWPWAACRPDCVPSVSAALQRVLQLAAASDDAAPVLALVTGSLYLVGGALEDLARRGAECGV